MKWLRYCFIGKGELESILKIYKTDNNKKKYLQYNMILTGDCHWI